MNASQDDAQLRFNVREALDKYQASFPEDECPTYVEIAVAMGISPSTLSRYSNNKVERPELSVIARLCAFLGIRDMNEMFELIIAEEEDNA